jgi:hypothetical protein
MHINNNRWQLPIPGSWLYLITTSTCPTRTKIGMTRHNPMARFAKLRCGDPFLCLHVAFYIPGNCPLHAIDFEKKLHALYAPLRIEFHNGGLSEWFQRDFQYLEMECEQFIENQFDDQSWLVSRFTNEAFYEGDYILKAFEDDLISYFGPPPILDEDGIPW